MTPEQVRAAMPPEMVRACDALKDRFGVKPVYIQTPTLQLGLDIETAEGQRKYRTKQSIGHLCGNGRRKRPCRLLYRPWGACVDECRSQLDPPSQWRHLR